MEIIKFDRIVSVNSELQGHSAQNILDKEISPNKNWMCEKGTEKAVVILQLERAVVLTSIHVGNAHSAFVEILVGKAADSSEQFEARRRSLVPMSVFMNPNESKTGTNPNRTRFFNKADFNEAITTKSWDRIKVVCSQPFNKHVPYGLCFLKVHGEKEGKKTEVFPKTVDSDEIQIGSFFKKRSSGGDKPLTDTERIKEASLIKHTPISIVNISEKLTSEKKPKPTNEEKGKEAKKISEDKTPKRKNDESVSEGITPKRKKDEQQNDDKTFKRKAGERIEDKKTLKREEEEKRRSEKKRRKKSFEKLMDDVVLVISGFKNPLRGNIRSMALKMGAKYSTDWEPNCTHLVCAYENTPKFHQVKGRGKIVKKDWVEKCHKDRKRYPWRRFALDKGDLKKAESEEEVDAGEESEPEEEEIASTSKFDTSAREKVEKSSPEKSKSGGEEYDRATDDEEENVVDTTEYSMPHLPDIFSLKTFYIDPNLQCKAILERYIIAYNGVLTDTFHEDVDFYVADKGGAPLESFRKKAPNLVAIKPSWIWEINSKQKYISTTLHLVE